MREGIKLKKIVVHQLIFSLFLMVYIFVAYISIPLYGNGIEGGAGIYGSQFSKIMEGFNSIYFLLFIIILLPLFIIVMLVNLIDEIITSIRFQLDNFLHIMISLIFLVILIYLILFVKNVEILGYILFLIDVLLLFSAVVIRRLYTLEELK